MQLKIVKEVKKHESNRIGNLFYDDECGCVCE